MNHGVVLGRGQHEAPAVPAYLRGAGRLNSAAGDGALLGVVCRHHHLDRQLRLHGRELRLELCDGGLGGRSGYGCLCCQGGRTLTASVHRARWHAGDGGLCASAEM